MPEDSLWPRFERSWRSWYKTAVKHDDENVRNENAKYYTIGKKHVEKNIGWKVTEIPHTGSLTVLKKSKWLTKGEKEGEKEYHVQYEIA